MVRFFVLALMSFSLSAFADARPDLIQLLNGRFRSSHRYIPSQVLLEEAVDVIGPDLLNALADLSREDLEETLAHPETVLNPPGLNKGIAENIVKLWKMAQHMRSLRSPVSRGGAVPGLRQAELDDMVRGLPDADLSSERKGEFDYGLYRIQRLALKSVLNNDVYNFRMAAGYFMEGKHETHRATFTLFSRGRKNRSFMVAVGQDQVLDMLQNLHFSEEEVQYLKSQLPPEVPEAFFEYLRDFKFRGTVRAVPTGTIVFGGEPILEVSGNPIEAQIVETLILPIVNAMTNFATKTARVVVAADGKPVVEGGTRRGINGLFSALAAYIGGVEGTSNTQIAHLFNIPAFGSLAHAWMGMHESQANHEVSELEAFSKYNRLYPTLSLLGDTYDIMSGIRNAIRAAGSNLKGVRLDSTLPGMNKSETAREIRTLLNSLGFTATTITYSDGLDEFELRRLAQDGAAFQMALVGTEIAAPSDAGSMNMVYKLDLVQDLTTGQSLYPIKLSSGKKGWPGSKQVVRFTDAQGQYERDLIQDAAEAIPAGGHALLSTVMDGGIRTAARPTPLQSRAHVKAELAKLPPRLKEIPPQAAGERAASYTVEYSDTLKQRQSAQESRLLPVRKKRVGVLFGSYDPVHEGHISAVTASRTLYDLDAVVFVPTGDSPVLLETKRYRFNAAQRSEILRHKTAHLDYVTISDSQTSGRTRFAIETLKELEAQYGAGTDFYIIGGEDLFQSVPQWKNSSELINNYHWVVARRGGDGKISLDPAFAPHHRQIDERHWVSSSGKFAEIMDVPALVMASSTKIRDRMSQVRAVFHEVDVQLTFWEAMHGMAAGPLAVPGTKAITANVAALKRLAQQSNAIKVIASKDSHYPIETQDPAVNPEFHADPNPVRPTDSEFNAFPPHAMAGVDGPVGDSRIPEVEIFSKVLTIPHHRMNEGLFELKPFNLDPVADLILDPEVEVLIEKNGRGSYDVFQNPRTDQIYARVNPDKRLPVFVYGVATDFCVRAAVLSLRARGFDVVVVEDAIAGVFDWKTPEALAEMQASGAVFMKTAEVLKQFEDTTCEGVVKARP